MIATFTQKIELRFWDVMIPLLTRSEWIRSVVRAVVKFYQNEKLSRNIAICFIVACGGFAAGILTYTLTSIL